MQHKTCDAFPFPARVDRKSKLSSISAEVLKRTSLTALRCGFILRPSSLCCSPAPLMHSHLADGIISCRLSLAAHLRGYPSDPTARTSCASHWVIHSSSPLGFVYGLTLIQSCCWQRLKLRSSTVTRYAFVMLLLNWNEGKTPSKHMHKYLAVHLMI